MCLSELLQRFPKTLHVTVLKSIIPIAFSSVQCSSLKSALSFAPSLILSVYLGLVVDLPECPVENIVHSLWIS